MPPSYGGACLDRDAVDYDCKGGSGDGPEYTVVGTDDFDFAMPLRSCTRAGHLQRELGADDHLRQHLAVLCVRMGAQALGVALTH